VAPDLQRRRVVNDVLAPFGFTGSSWISTPDTAIYTLVLLSVWQFGSPMIIFLAGLRQIPQDIYEAASMDGASKWRQFRRITLPLLGTGDLLQPGAADDRRVQGLYSAFIISGGTGGPIDSTLFYTLYLYEEDSAISAWGTHRRWHGCC
jgi:multiple sugar transport system permease protein